MQVINDYGLKFGGTIKFIDGFGELKAKIGKGKSRVVVYKWNEIYERNDAKPEDVIICEILCEGCVVLSIKVHFFFFFFFVNIKVHFVKNRCVT